MNVSGYTPSQDIFNLNFNTDNTIKDTTDTTNSTNANSSVSFSDVLKTSLDNLNTQQVQADNITNSYVKGGNVDVADVMLQTEEAKMNLQYAIQVRNKVLDAYSEISKMQM